MTSSVVQPTDPWASWLFAHRFEDHSLLQECRQRVLTGARLSAGQTVLDVGTGDGFVAFGAVPEIEPDGQIVFLDTSDELLKYCRDRMTKTSGSVSAKYIKTSAETLDGVPETSVDAVLCRSVLVYLNDKRAALSNFARVLRPGGRLSIFEFVAQYGWTERRNSYLTWEIASLGQLGKRLDRAFQELDTSTEQRYGFSERDLVGWAEEVRLHEIHLDFTIDISPMPPMPWADALEWAPNPCAPTLAEALHHEFNPAEQDAVTRQLRPIIERGEGTMPAAWAHLTATK